MSTATLPALVAIFQAGGSAPASTTTDPVVLTSVLNAALATKLDNTPDGFSGFTASLPTFSAGLAVGALWNHGGIITRVQ